MITIKCTQVLKDFKGKNLKDGPEEELSVGACLSTIMGGDVTNKQWGWELGKKFATEKTVDLTIEKANFVMEEIKKSKHPYLSQAMISGQLIDILETKVDK